MNQRLVYLICGLAGLMLLIAGVSTLSAQRPPFPPPAFQPAPGFGGMGFMGGPQQGRFTVAFASATKVLVLDTATGKVYHAKEADFLDIANLPKPPEPPQPPGANERGKERDRREKLEDSSAVKRPR